MRRPIQAVIATFIIATSVAGIVSLAGTPFVAPLFAQTGAGPLEGAAAFGDWRADRPGTRRLIRPQDMPGPDLTQSARNAVRIVHRTDQKPIVPNGFEVNLFASGLTEPRLIRTAPNGDLFVAERAAGRIRVLRANRNEARQPTVFASGLGYPFGIAFYPPGPEPQWVYIGNTDSVVRFPYRNGDTTARGAAETVVPRLAIGGHHTRDLAFAPDGKTAATAGAPAQHIYHWSFSQLNPTAGKDAEAAAEVVSLALLECPVIPGTETHGAGAGSKSPPNHARMGGRKSRSGRSAR